MVVKITTFLATKKVLKRWGHFEGVKSASTDSTFMSHNTGTRLNPILNAHNSARFGISVVVNNPLRPLPPLYTLLLCQVSSNVS